MKSRGELSTRFGSEGRRNRRSACTARATRVLWAATSKRCYEQALGISDASRKPLTLRDGRRLLGAGPVRHCRLTRPGREGGR
jgi:hypothetical protein